MGRRAPGALIAHPGACERRALVVELEVQGFHVRCIDTWEELPDAAQALRPDVLVLHRRFAGVATIWKLPEIAQAYPELTIIMVGMAGGLETALALVLGAADACSAPFDRREAASRILSRAAGKVGSTDFAERAPKWRLDPSARRLQAGDDFVASLNPAQTAVVSRLFACPGEVVSREALADALGDDASGMSPRVVDRLIHSIRTKVAAIDAAEVFETVRGSGYRFCGQIEP
jgi:DNA-binding response OmpR family regulator